jgi:hypothetical protein
MSKKIISRLKVRELYDAGQTVTEIAAQMGCGKGAVSKILKKMGLEVTKAAVKEAPKYIERRDAATEHLLFLAEKARKELEWIEDSVPPKTDEEYRAWQDQKLKFAAEMRKLIGAVADIGYKLFQQSEMVEIIKIIDEEVGNESSECQKRIRERLQRRQHIRLPLQIN